MADGRRLLPTGLALKIEFDDRYSQASTYHQLGTVALKQQQWLAAENYYQQALTVYIEFNDRYEQTRTYSRLGSLEESKGNLREATNYLLKAMSIYTEF